jgi:hypothetical protein
MAANVTAVPLMEGLGAEDKLVAVAAWVTVCAIAVDVLAMKLLSPP